ncbi:FKBP-type peptidyl-prolyl cis-trans isomerase N-terminal domain-containing protein, partial [Bullifex porci]
MKKILLILFIVLALISCKEKEAAPAPTQIATEKVEHVIATPETLEEKFAYVYGYQLLNSIITSIPELEKEYFLDGVRAYVDNDFTYSMEESQSIMNEYQQKRYESYEAEMAELREKNLAAAESFLQTNKKRSGVVSISDKLQYEVLREPTEGGKSATNKSTVTVDYRLITLSGEVKDSSYE